METQVAELNQTIEKLREQLATANGEKDKANQALGSVKAELDELQNDYNWLGDKYL